MHGLLETPDNKVLKSTLNSNLSGWNLRILLAKQLEKGPIIFQVNKPKLAQLWLNGQLLEALL